MPVKTAYHYLNEGTWQNLIEKREEEVVLEPQRRFLRLHIFPNPDMSPTLPTWAHDQYLFAFPDNLAEQVWGSYPQHEREVDALMQQIGDEIILVKFDISSRDRAFVVDRAYYADFQWGIEQDKKAALIKYAKSRTRAVEYVGGFRMPELIIKNSVPIERVSVHSRYERRIVRDGEGWKGILKQIQ